MMRLYRPRSFFSLLLSGFVFVALPLLIALFSSIRILDDLVQHSAGAVFRSVSRVDNTRQLVDLLHNQERAARLYNVLGEPDHLRDLNALYKESKSILFQLGQDNENKQFDYLIERMLVLSRGVVDVFNITEGIPEELKKQRETSLTAYTELNNFSARMERLSNTLMVNEVDTLKTRVHRSKAALVWLISGLIGFSVLLIVVFIFLIIKPIHQIDQGIDRLGKGDFSTQIAVSGSRDMEALGEKLDWLRKRLSELDKEKVKMIAHISHELKTPLASIREGAGLLKEGLVGTLNTSQQEVVTILDNNSDKLHRLIENILDFNMAQAMETPVDFSEIDLEEIIQEVASEHHNLILARNIDLTLNLTKTTVITHRKQIKTVFDNLLANAIKFTPKNGFIRISMHNKPRHVTLIVEDSGPGVSKEDEAQIFLPFYQGTQQKKAAVKGSGLGLAISKEYVQNCGGKLRLLSSKAGARFAVTLPRTEGGTT